MKAQKYDELVNQYKTQTAFEEGQKAILEKLRAKNAEIARNAALNAAIAYNNKGLTDYGRDILNGKAPQDWFPGIKK